MAEESSPPPQPKVKKVRIVAAVKESEELVSRGEGEEERNWRGLLIALLVISVVLSLILASCLALSPPDRGPRASLPKLSVGGLASSFRHLLNATWISDSELAFRDHLGGISIFDANTGKTSQFINNSTFRMLNAQQFLISPDKKYIVLIADIKKVYSHTSTALYTMVERETSYRYPVGPDHLDMELRPGRLQKFIFSPTSSSFAFVHENDLYFCRNPPSAAATSPSSAVVRLTESGSEVIYNGAPDWLYQEEILRSDTAAWFSPSGDYIVYATFNDSLVNEVQLPLYLGPHSGGRHATELLTVRYPKAGGRNPEVRLHLVDLRNNSYHQTELATPTSITATGGYLLGVRWSDADLLQTIWMRRSQNATLHMTCPPPHFICVKTYLDVGWTEDEELAPVTPRAGRSLITPLRLHPTFGNFTYFEGRPEEQRNERHLYRTSDTDGKEECLTCPLNASAPRLQMGQDQPGQEEVRQRQSAFRSQDCVYVSAEFSTRGTYYLLHCLGPEVPSSHIVKTSTNTWLQLFENNTALQDAYNSFSIPQIKIFNVGLEGDEKATVRLMMPAGLRIGEEMTFPLIVNLSYRPGAAPRGVSSRWRVDYPTYLVSMYNYLVLEVEPASRKSNLQDHIAVIKYILGMDFVDPRKTAVLADGFGGYMAVMMSSMEPKLFKSFVITSGVFSFGHYNSFWSERYGLGETDCLSEAESGGGLKSDSRGGSRLLLLHGTGDLAAHYSQAMGLSHALLSSNILYHHIAYPDVGGDFTGYETHLYKTIDEFLQRTLEPLDYTEWETGSSYFSFSS